MAKARYHDIVLDLKAKIEDNEYSYNDYLPSENELADTYLCSRNTLRRALEELSNIGYVSSIKGKGVLVTYNRKLLSKFGNIGNNFYDEISSTTKKKFHTTVLRFEEMIVDKSLSEKSTLEVGETVYYLLRQRLVDNHPYIIEHNYYLKGTIEGLTKSIAEDSVYDYLQKKMEDERISQRRYLTVERVTELDQRYLGLDDYNAIPVVTTFGFNKRGQLFEYTESHHQAKDFVFYNQSDWNPVTFLNVE